jgi:hypothetical protein
LPIAWVQLLKLWLEYLFKQLFDAELRVEGQIVVLEDKVSELQNHLLSNGPELGKMGRDERHREHIYSLGVGVKQLP